MSSYATCWLDDFLVGSSRNGIDSDLISLFRTSDKVVLSSPIPELPLQLHHYIESLEEDSDLQIVYYESPIEVVRDRLNIIGYTLDTSKKAFQEWIHGEIENITELMEDWNSRNDKAKDLMIKHYQNEIEILSTITPDLWIEGLKVIRTSELKPNYYGRYEGLHENALIGYMLSHDWYGFPGYDMNLPLRLAIEACETGKKFIYDLTDLVWSEYFDYDEDFVEYSSNAKTIVLTEGKTDAWILEQSLRILYPHLQDYFSFLNFESTNIGGGVGNLANMVKAFAGAGIINNIVALFDNDTAAAAACKTLETITFPSNIVIRRLPELNFLSNYPTIGPSGEMELNVNGIAASIELYLGDDVLKIDGERLIPVQWTGYDRGINQYQGEVLEKAELYKRFQCKVENRNKSLGHEWDGLELF